MVYLLNYQQKSENSFIVTTLTKLFYSTSYSSVLAVE